MTATSIKNDKNKDKATQKRKGKKEKERDGKSTALESPCTTKSGQLILKIQRAFFFFFTLSSVSCSDPEKYQFSQMVT